MIGSIITIGIFAIFVWMMVSLVFYLIAKLFVLLFGGNYLVTMTYKYRDYVLKSEFTSRKFIKAMSAQGAYAKFIENIIDFDGKEIISVEVKEVDGL